MSLALYRLATVLGTPLVGLWLHRRRAAGKEAAARQGERTGRADRARPPGELIWLHAASVGESVSALPLIERLLGTRPDAHALVTTVTVTSARIMAERLPERAFHQYAPVDTPGAVRRFLDHWAPDRAIWIESELWPNMIAMSRARGIPPRPGQRTPVVALPSPLAPRATADIGQCSAGSTWCSPKAPTRHRAYVNWARATPRRWATSSTTPRPWLRIRWRWRACRPPSGAAGCGSPPAPTRVRKRRPRRRTGNSAHAIPSC